jgi:hypothetical protein
MRQDDGPSAAAGSPSSSADPRAARNAASRRFRDLTAGLVLRTGVPARVEGEACALEAVPLGAAPDGRSGFALRLLARAPGLVAGLPWQLRSRDGSERRGGLTDAAGRVVVADLPPGDHDLAIEPLRGVPRRFPLRPITLPASLPRAVDHLTLGRADDPLRGVLRSYCQHRLFVTAWLSAAAFGPEPPLRGRPLLVVQIVAPGAGHRILARGIIGLVRSGGGAVRGDLDLEALGGEALLRELSGPGSPGRELHLLPTTTLDLARLAPPLLRAAARDLGASRPHTPEFHAEGTEHRAAQATLEAMARSREAGAACAGVPRPPSPHPGRATTGEVGCEALQGLLRRSADDGRGDSDGPRPWPEELAALEPASRMGLLESLLDDPELAVPLSQACGRALASLRAGAAARLVPPCGSLG